MIDTDATDELRAQVRAALAEGDALTDRGRLDEGWLAVERALDLLRRHAPAPRLDDLAWETFRAETYGAAVDRLMNDRFQDSAAALRIGREGAAIAQAVRRARGPHRPLVEAEAALLHNSAAAASRLRRHAEAGALFDEATELERTQLGRQHLVAGLHFDHAGDLYYALRGLSADDPRYAELRRRAEAEVRRGVAATPSDAAAVGARPLYQLLIAVWNALDGAVTIDRTIAADVAAHFLAVADLCRAIGIPDAALAMLVQRARAVVAALDRPDPLASCVMEAIDKIRAHAAPYLIQSALRAAADEAHDVDRPKLDASLRVLADELRYSDVDELKSLALLGGVLIEKGGSPGLLVDPLLDRLDAETIDAVARPLVAALVRSEGARRRARAHATARRLVADNLHTSEPWRWLALAVELLDGAPITVIDVRGRRGWIVEAHEVSSLGELWLLLCDVLIGDAAQGLLPGPRPPRTALAALRAVHGHGEAARYPLPFTALKWPALDRDGALRPYQPAADWTLWRNDRPSDLPLFEGKRVMLLDTALPGPTLEADRPLPHLEPEVRLRAVCAPGEVDDLLRRLARAVD